MKRFVLIILPSLILLISATVFADDVNGWVTKHGNQYYYINGEAVVGLKTIDGELYYFGQDGKMYKGLLKRDGKYYYFLSDGKGVKDKGWFNGQDGKKRYSIGGGQVAFGKMKIDGVWYEFYSSDATVRKVLGSDADNFIQKQPSRTKYLITLKLSEHKVLIHKGKKGNWKQIKSIRCTTGAKSTPTIKGLFEVGSKGKYFNTGKNCRCWYYTQIHGNYLFHSILYKRASSPKKIADGRLGVSVSHGCVRMPLSDAKWIYKNIPRKTKVVIY